MKLTESSYKEFEDKRPEIGLLPTGSTEQHGPHGPLGTDSLIAERMATHCAEATGALLLPEIRVGVSREHSSFPGTLWVSPETFRHQLTEIILSAHESGLEKFVVVNGHGGNVSSIRAACKKLYHEQEIKALEWTWFNAISTQGLGHAGQLETSLLKYLQPESISQRPERGSSSWGRTIHGSRVDYDTQNFAPDGTVGDPTKASEVRGEELFTRSTEKLINLIEEMRDQNFSFS